MEGKTIGIIIAVIVVLAGGWYLLYAVPAGAPSPAVTNQMPVVGSTTPEMIVENALLVVTILYGDQFSPKSVTVPLGTTVEFVDRSPEKDMWVSSAPHPTHQGYDGTTAAEHCAAGYAGPKPFDQCGTGTSFSFTFNKAGTWNYHNHKNAADFGTVIVTATASVQIDI